MDEMGIIKIRDYVGHQFFLILENEDSEIPEANE